MHQRRRDRRRQWPPGAALKPQNPPTLNLTLNPRKLGLTIRPQERSLVEFDLQNGEWWTVVVTWDMVLSVDRAHGC